LNEALAAQLAVVEAVEVQLADLEVKWAAGELVQLAYERAKPVLDKRLAKERARLDGLERPAAPTEIKAEADWMEMEPNEKRVLITRFQVPIRIGPHKPGVRRFDPGRVKIGRVKTRRS
jgi:hypothetical protein